MSSTQLPDTFRDWYASDDVQAWWKKYAKDAAGWRDEGGWFLVWSDSDYMTDEQFAWMLIGAATASGRVSIRPLLRGWNAYSQARIGAAYKGLHPDPITALMAAIDADIAASKSDGGGA